MIDSKEITTPVEESMFSLGKKNYILMLIACAIVFLGFFMMSGGKSEDPNVFSREIFSDTRITWAPLTVFFGYMFLIYAILTKAK